MIDIPSSHHQSPMQGSMVQKLSSKYRAYSVIFKRSFPICLIFNLVTISSAMAALGLRVLKTSTYVACESTYHLLFSYLDGGPSFNWGNALLSSLVHIAYKLSVSRSFSPPHSPGTILHADVDDHIQMQAFQSLGIHCWCMSLSFVLNLIRLCRFSPRAILSDVGTSRDMLKKSTVWGSGNTGT